MNKEKLKLIIRNLESLLECLKSEVYSEEDNYKSETQYEDISPYIDDYDEVFYDEEDDEMYGSLKVNEEYKPTNNNGGRL